MAKVLLAAKVLNYRQPFQPEQDVAAKRENVIAVFMPSATGNYYTAISYAINCAAEKASFDTILFEAYRDRERELRGLTFISNQPIAGCIFTYIPYHQDLVEEISKRLPVVIIGNQVSQAKVDMIETDSYRAGMLMAQHLIDLGHRHVAFLATDRSWPGYPSSQRIQGVRDTFQQASGTRLTERIEPIGSSLQLDSKAYSVKLGAQMALSCLDDLSITGFIAVNDYIAYGVLDALANRGFRVPQDYSVCGCDDIFPSSLSQVSLTSVNHHLQEKGESAFHLLHRRIKSRQVMAADNEPTEQITRMEYLSTLIVRGTTARPPAGRHT